MTTNMFELAGGSIPGGDHLQRGNLLIGKNNQDAFATYPVITGKPLESDLLVAVVADGCGSKPASEVGSSLGSQLLVASLVKQWNRFAHLGSQDFEQGLAHTLEASRQDVIANLRILASAMQGEGSFSQTVNDHFLFTLVGGIVTPFGAGFFSIGDGVIVVNGEMIQIGPFPGNEPPYIAYALYASRWTDAEIRFKVHRIIKAEDFESFLLGTDGAGDLANASETIIPGTEEEIGPLSQFWTGKFNKTGIRRKLARINSTTNKVLDGRLVTEKARLPDDTTLVVGRRKEEVESEEVTE